MEPEDVRARIEGVSSEHGFSGVCLATVAGETVFSLATGFAHRGHRVPDARTTRFAVASVTKMITAAATLALVDDGRLDLTAPLVGILPPDLLPRDVSRRLTTHHLLTHTSGIADYFDQDVEDWAPFLACWDEIPTYHVRSCRDLVPLFAGKPAAAAPGGPLHYTNANFILAGLVCEHVADAAFPTLVEQRVFARAGMTASAFAALDTEPADLAVGYLRPTHPGGHWRSNIYSVPAVSLPDGGMITTADDLTRFVGAISQGTLLSAASTKAMLTAHAAYPDEPGLHYGYGTILSTTAAGIARFGHGGSDPGVNATVRHYPDHDATIVVLANVDQEGAELSAADIADLIETSLELGA